MRGTSLGIPPERPFQRSRADRGRRRSGRCGLGHSGFLARELVFRVRHFSLKGR